MSRRIAGFFAFSYFCLSLVTGNSFAEGQQNSLTSPSEGDDFIWVPSPVPAYRTVDSSDSYYIFFENKSFAAQLREAAKNFGWKLKWESKYDWLVAANTWIPANDFIGLIRNISEWIKESKYPLKIKVYIQNNVVVVTDEEANSRN